MHDVMKATLVKKYFCPTEPLQDCKYLHVSHLTINLALRRYRYAPHNDISVKDGPHIRRSHNIIIPLCYNCLQYSVHNILCRFVAYEQ